MGNKSTKDQVDQLLQLTGKEGQRALADSSRAELVGCLASIADMANTGHGSALPSGHQGAANNMPPVQPPEALMKMNGRLRRRLESLRGSTDDAEMVDALMALEDSEDWSSMRSWLVWCMHANLDESSDDSPPAPATRGRLRRQASVDVGNKSRLEPQRHIDPDPRMSAQNSMESNAET